MGAATGRTYRTRSGTMVTVAAIALFAGLMTAPPALARQAKPRILPPQSRPFGMTYGEWSAKWWQWALASPAADNPVLDPTGANCATGQAGRVWFLAGTFGGGPVTRTCTVPLGTALFFPVVNTFCAAEPGDDPDPQIQRQCASASLAGATGSVEIDGTPVQNLSVYFVDPATSPVFSITLPEDNVFGAPAGTYAPAVAGGIYLMLAPLPPGEHVIHVQGSGPGFTVDVTYHLTVTRGRRI